MIVHADDAIGLLLGPAEHGQQDGDQGRDDRDHHQQLNQRKRFSALHTGSGCVQTLQP